MESKGAVIVTQVKGSTRQEYTVTLPDLKEALEALSKVETILPIKTTGGKVGNRYNDTYKRKKEYDKNNRFNR